MLKKEPITENAENKEKPVENQTPNTKIKRYLGPSLPILPNNTVFENGKMSKGIELLLEQNPSIRRLVVPEDKVAQTLVNLQNPHSVESVFYKKIAELSKKS